MEARLPNWFLPVAVCGGLPSALCLCAALGLFIVWMFRDRSPTPTRDELAPIEVAHNADSVRSEAIEEAAHEAQEAVSSAADDTSDMSAATPTPEASEHEQDSVTVDSTAVRPEGIQILNLPFIEIKLGRQRAQDPVVARAYAYDPDTGYLAILFRPKRSTPNRDLSSWGSSIHVIDIDEQPQRGVIRNVKQIDIPGEPYDLAHKARLDGGLFAALQTDRNGIVLIDAHSLEVAKAIPLENDHARFLPDSDGAKSRYLYYTTTQPSQYDYSTYQAGRRRVTIRAPSNLQIHRIDAGTLEVDESLNVGEFETEGIAAIGDTAVYYQVGLVNVSVHANSNFIALLDGVYSAATLRRLTKLDFAARTFLSNDPWVVGFKPGELVVGSINDGRVVAGIPMKERQASFSRSNIAEVFLDPKRNCVIACLLRQVMVVPISHFGLPDEPMLFFVRDPPTTAKRNDLYEFPLEIMSGNATVTLVEGPEGMEVQGDVLRWRPETAYVGALDVKVKIAADHIEREYAWQIFVE